MAIVVDTKDCTALGDAELAGMADICADGPAGYDVGLLSKQRDEWVLVTQAREGNRLHGFSFCTLERIGGTPCVLVGMASVRRTSKRDTVLRAIMGDQLRRAVLAFPDEDVLVGTRLLSASGFQAFKSLDDIVPRPGHKATGEERAWSRGRARGARGPSGRGRRRRRDRRGGARGAGRAIRSGTRSRGPWVGVAVRARARRWPPTDDLR